MKFLVVLCALTLLSGCDDYTRVLDAYDERNPVARELLLNGFNDRVGYHVSTKLLKKALQGDEEAKLIILAQMESLRGMMPERRTTIVPIITPTATRSCRGR